MKIALIGHGKMGKLIEHMAQAAGDDIVATCSSTLCATRHHLEAADVCIDFSHADCTLDTIRLCTQLNKPLVIGTTGWEQHLPQAREWVNQAAIGCIYSPNFAIGVYLFIHMVAQAADMMSRFEQYDVAAMEAHHNQKRDQPSGTAKAIAAVVEQKMQRPLAFTSMRCGHIPGTHSVVFDSPCDSITLTHQARNREGFAQGALQAAAWIRHQKGFYTMQEWMENATIYHK